MEAKIILKYFNEKAAKAIAQAISPDNIKTPLGIDVKTSVQKCTVLTLIQCHKELPTFISTIDDVLCCASTAEKTILSIDRTKK